MDADDVLERLSGLPPTLFERVIFQAEIPEEHLPGVIAPQTTRAIADVALGVHRVRPYAIAEATDPVAVGPGAFRVTRGGSWSSRALAVRAASRRSASRLLRVPCYGFRLAAGALAPRT